MKKRTTYSTHVKVFLTILVTALLLIEVSASEHHVIAQAELTDEELADTLVMETIAALGWDQTPDEDSAFSSVFELEHYLTNANATYFVAGGNAFYYYALVSVFPTDEDAEAYLQQVLNHEAMTKQVLWSGPDEDWGTWWWSRDSQPATFHGINAVQAHHQGYEPSQGPYFLGWPMRNFFIGCFETPSTNSGGYKLGCTEFLYQTALNYGLGIELSPNPEPPDLNPNPEPNPNPDPNPDPGPIEIDSETLRILQSILGTPIIPITGAVAGGLVAWILSMLGGGRTVLPPPPRPPTGGLRPGQVGPNGKVWSPQGWVSKATYDYQQKWLQKGWRLNPQTNKLEVQPGAVNESGQVWYKLPHEMDEGDSYYWVDKAKVQECERNLAEGNVWDRNMGWQTSNDLKKIQSERDAMRQRSREFNAQKNAQIQKDVQNASQKSQEEYQKWLKKYEQKEQMPVNLAKLNADLEAIDQDLKKQNIYVTNKLQGDPTLIFQGLEVLTNGVWDSTIGNFTGSQGFTCGNYVDKTINPVTEAVKKQFPGAKVQQVVFEEKSTKNPSGFFGTLDSWNTENHTLIKVTIPDGPELAVDFHQHNASNVLENPPIVQPYDKAREPWKKYLGDDFMETIE